MVIIDGGISLFLIYSVGQRDVWQWYVGLPRFSCDPGPVLYLFFSTRKLPNIHPQPSWEAKIEWSCGKWFCSWWTNSGTQNTYCLIVRLESEIGVLCPKSENWIMKLSSLSPSWPKTLKTQSMGAPSLWICINLKWLTYPFNKHILCTHSRIRWVWGLGRTE